MAYRREYRIEFNHCDPAGIVFYPRYFEMLNSVVETFFRDVGACPFSEVVAGGNGSPTVRTEAVFRAPSRLGDMIRFTLKVTGIGRSSIDFHTEIHGADEGLRAEFRHRVVWTEGPKSAPWPDALRARFTAAMKEDTP